MQKLATIPAVILIVSVTGFVTCMICVIFISEHFRRRENASISPAAANACLPNAEVVVTPLIPVVYVDTPAV